LPRYVSFIDQSVEAAVRFVVADNLIAPFQLSKQSKLVIGQLRHGASKGRWRDAIGPDAGMPIRGTFDAGCCARAASGHATAAPPRSVMNSRRFMSNMALPPPASGGRP
jgi:hypothetical protein